jgi:hypothetical protein
MKKLILSICLLFALSSMAQQPIDRKKVVELKKQLKAERLRADFYEEMVAFGKDAYGIDLKKTGTK